MKHSSSWKIPMPDEEVCCVSTWGLALPILLQTKHLQILQQFISCQLGLKDVLVDIALCQQLIILCTHVHQLSKLIAIFPMISHQRIKCHGHPCCLLCWWLAGPQQHSFSYSLIQSFNLFFFFENNLWNNFPKKYISW